MPSNTIRRTSIDVHAFGARERSGMRYDGAWARYRQGLRMRLASNMYVRSTIVERIIVVKRLHPRRRASGA